MKQNQKRNRRGHIALMIAILRLPVFSRARRLAIQPTDMISMSLCGRTTAIRLTHQCEFLTSRSAASSLYSVYDDELRKTMKITDVDTGDVPHKTYEKAAKLSIGLQGHLCDGTRGQCEISIWFESRSDKNVEVRSVLYDLCPTEWETPIGACESQHGLPKPVKSRRSRFTWRPYSGDIAEKRILEL